MATADGSDIRSKGRGRPYVSAKFIYWQDHIKRKVT